MFRNTREAAQQLVRDLRLHDTALRGLVAQHLPAFGADPSALRAVQLVRAGLVLPNNTSANGSSGNNTTGLGAGTSSTVQLVNITVVATLVRIHSKSLSNSRLQ